MRDILGIRTTRVDVGIYKDCGFNFRSDVDMTDWEEFFHDDEVPAYGVADSIEQFLERFGAIITASPRSYAVGFTEVRRADQEPRGGWRWHKWGEYIGKHEPQYEYLYDEPLIESVVTFSVIRSKDGC
jgi:hypothetical protein